MDVKQGPMDNLGWSKDTLFGIAKIRISSWIASMLRLAWQDAKKDSVERSFCCAFYLPNI